MVKVKVKHEKQTMQVDVDPADGLETMKAVIQSVSGVPGERQKLIVKGTELREDTDLSKFIKPGAAILLQGSTEATSAEAIPKDLLCEYTREPADAPLGIACANDTGPDGKFCTLKTVVEGSSADKAGAKRFLGRPLRRACGTPVDSSEAVLAATKGQTQINLLFDQRWAGGGKEDVIHEQPPGLENLGNTCYLNSAVQTLHNVGPLRELLSTSDLPPIGSQMTFLMGIDSSGAPQSDQCLASSLRHLFSQLEESRHGEPIEPRLFVSAVKRRFPTFAQTTPQGQPMQQDAEEFLRALLQSVRQATKGEASKIFEGRRRSTARCIETDVEPPKVKEEPFDFLVCSLDSETATLEHGLKLGLKDHRSAASEVLGRDAEYEITHELTGLPDFCLVQIARFAWRKDTQNKAKKLRKVQYPFKLDLYPYCTEEKRKSLDKRREELGVERDRLMELKRLLKQKGAAAAEGTAAAAAMDVDKDKPAEAAGAAPAAAAAEKHADAMEVDEPPPEPLKQPPAKGQRVRYMDSQGGGLKNATVVAVDAHHDPPSYTIRIDGQGSERATERDRLFAAPDAACGNDSGYYELCGVITHAGRTADSGHYKAFIKKEGDWWCFDDTRAYKVNEDKIRDLYGGGESDSGYLLLYRSRDEAGMAAGLW